MRSIGDTYPPVSSATLVVPAKMRASGKINPTSSLHTSLGDDARPETRSGKDRRKTAPCQSGTPGTVPFRYSPHAPRLDAAFVAQMLGQIMPEGAAGNMGTLAAYEEAPSSAQVFDTRL